MSRNAHHMTESQIETLAHDRTLKLGETDRADSSYLRALIYSTQAKLGPKPAQRSRGNRHVKTQLAALAAVAAPFYAAVLRGVTTPDIAVKDGLDAAEASRRSRERNRRATFARSTKSTLVAWVRLGGDIRMLDVATVAKSELRSSVAAARDPTLAAETGVERAQSRIIHAIAAEAEADTERARERLKAVIEALQAELDALSGAPRKGPKRARGAIHSISPPRMHPVHQQMAA